MILSRCYYLFSTIHFFGNKFFFVFLVICLVIWFSIYLALDSVYGTSQLTLRTLALNKIETKIFSHYAENSSVVYFDQLLGAVGTQKLVEILFFRRFQPFFFFLNIIQWISVWNQEKNLKKLCFKLLFKAGWHANAGRLPEGVTQICLFQFIFNHF